MFRERVRSLAPQSMQIRMSFEKRSLQPRQ
jgi:hypothetical protein